jgi:hypothetical protein
MKQNSEIILDSVINGERITTFRYEIWRPIHAELMTYRNCARNASSSRAIPAKINIDRVRYDPFIPSHVGKEHKGMSPNEFLDERTYAMFVNDWRFCAIEAANRATTLLALGVSKSIINRVLEPYNTINCLMTGAPRHWEWLFKQRTAPDAEPNLRELVLAMQEQYVNSIPVGRGFHLPFFDDHEREDRGDYECALISAARCARLSYCPHGSPARNIEADLALAERLLTSRHLSPFEHIIWGEAEGANAISHRVVTLRQSLGF